MISAGMIPYLTGMKIMMFQLSDIYCTPSQSSSKKTMMLIPEPLKDLIRRTPKTGWRATPTPTGEGTNSRPPFRPAPMLRGQPAPGRRAALPEVQHSLQPSSCERFGAPMGWACLAELGSPPPQPQWRTHMSPRWERVAHLHARHPLPRQLFAGPPVCARAGPSAGLWAVGARERGEGRGARGEGRGIPPAGLQFSHPLGCVR